MDGLYDDCVEIVNKYKLQCDSEIIIEKSINTKEGNDLVRNLSIRSKNEINNDLDLCNPINEGNDDDLLKFINNDKNKNLSQDNIRVLITNSIRKQVEIELYLPVSIKLGKILQSSQEQEENLLKIKMDALYAYPQSYYGIPDIHISPSR
jgi:hypothetical protein